MEFEQWIQENKLEDLYKSASPLELLQLKMAHKILGNPE